MPKPSDLSATVREQWREFMVEFGVNLQQARHRLGYSQEFVAAQAGIGHYTYMRYEQGLGQSREGANPLLTNLVALAEVLETPIEELLPREYPDIRRR